MKILELSFELRNNYDELPDLLNIINNMTFNKSTKNVDIEIKQCFCKSKILYYCYINIDFRSKTSVASISICQDLSNKPSSNDFFNVNLLNEIKVGTYFPIFNTDDTGKIIKISIYTNFNDLSKLPHFIIPLQLHEVKEDVLSISSESFFNLFFFLKKPFEQLDYFLTITKRMINRGAYNTINISSNDFLLNLNFFLKSDARPSLVIQLQLLENFRTKERYLRLGKDISKYNFISNNYRDMVPVSMLTQKYDDIHGPFLVMVVGKSYSEKTQEEIEKQCHLFDVSIS